VDISSGGTRLLTSDATIADTTISFNEAGIPQGSVPVATQGGGISVLAAKLAVTNTTISNNTSVGPGGQTASIGNHQGEVTLNNVTIADNSAVGFTGGIEAGAKTTLSNTILTDNTDASGESDCSGELVSKDYNVVLDTKCTFSGETTHDIVGRDPMLAPLADHGGTPAPLAPPQTRAPMGALILSAGNPATPNGKSGHCEPEDETGLPGHERVVCRCDVGAYPTPPGCADAIGIPAGAPLRCRPAGNPLHRFWRSPVSEEVGCGRGAGDVQEEGSTARSRAVRSGRLGGGSGTERRSGAAGCRVA